MPDLSWPFAGLPAGWEVVLSVVFVVVVAMFCWTVILFVRGLRAAAHAPPAPDAITDDFLWVFLVPALNEELTIADSVRRLLDLPLRHRAVMVINDGSDDRTGSILDDLRDPHLVVIHRQTPHAREGKGAALNDAYRMVEGIRGDFRHDRVIVCVVDADGRLAADAPEYAAAHFGDASVGGVQVLVRIYNRGRLLTWLQDLEFSVYGWLFQAGRTGWGTAGMGGNGQFNRLSALEDVADSHGPWRDRLTEDQDLGLRLIAAGWKSQQELRGTVDQQGLSNLRRLLRQRTRWSQGNLQAMSLIPKILRAPLPLRARLEQVAYLLMPWWQGVIGVGLVSAIYLLATGTAPLYGAGTVWQILFFYLLGFGGTVMGCIAARSNRGPVGWLVGFVEGHPYAFYTWMIWPVLTRSVFRQLTSRRQWARTEREALEEPNGLPAGGQPGTGLSRDGSARRSARPRTPTPGST
jgi:cellulose synthase/poly-beta-1,6-N-acetylglucosamine synthase-like glycosyltransferase